MHLHGVKMRPAHPLIINQKLGHPDLTESPGQPVFTIGDSKLEANVYCF